MIGHAGWGMHLVARLLGRARVGLRGRLILLLTVIGGLLFVVAAGSILVLDQARLAASSRVAHELQEMKYLDEIQAAAREQGRAVLTGLVTTDLDQVADLETRIAAGDGRVRAAFSQLAGIIVDDPEPAQRRLRALVDAYEAMAEVRDRQLIPASRLPDHGAADALVRPGGAFQSASDRFAGALAAMRVQVGNELMGAVEDGDLAFARVRTLMLAGMLVIDGLAVALAALLANRTAQRVLRVAAAAEQVSAGELDVRLGVRDVEASDEVGQAAGAFNQMAATLQAQSMAIESAARETAETAALRELSRQQRRMLTLISHELNTPLSLWYGFSQLLASRDEVPEPLRKQLEIMHEGATRLKVLVATMTELMALEGPAVEIDRRTLDLGPLVAGWVADAGGPPRIELSIGSDLPRVSGDRALLDRAVAHLVENGLKFSQPDTTVGVELRRRDGDLDISVSNESVPIPKRELDRLFDPFYRTEETERQVVPGPGLGLALVRRIAELHGGSIAAANTPDGVRLTLRLPAAP